MSIFQEIDESSIHLYLDDGNNYAALVNVNALRGRAFVDPRTAKLDSLLNDPPTPSVRGSAATWSATVAPSRTRAARRSTQTA